MSGALGRGALLLHAEEELQLAKQIEVVAFAGRKLRRDLTLIAEEGRAAKCNLVQGHLRLVVAIARRCRRGGMVVDDLIQEGDLVLIHAVEKYHCAKGVGFSAYATCGIGHSLQRALRNEPCRLRVGLGRHALDLPRRIVQSAEQLPRGAVVGTS